MADPPARSAAPAWTEQADLRVRAPAKINLHLEVLGLRPDGFHELAMVMQSLDLTDRLHLRRRDDGELRLSCDEPTLPLGRENLILRAAEALRARAWDRRLGADLHLEKRIPIGAGLAGGSSDGAAALVGLDALWGLGTGAGALHALAGELGSDMPFCLEGGTRLCFGRGERLEAALAGPPPPLGVLLVKQAGSSVSTPWAYARCRELRGDFYLERESDFEARREALRQGPLRAALRGEREVPPLRNDLQEVVAPAVEGVRQGLDLLRQQGDALAVAMSGSGPSLFALYPSQAAATGARAALEGALREGGYEAWCCRFTGSGVTLETAAGGP